ncbi:MAG: hypothetical protein JO112_08015, partial [Planctomycetes bacterium]|nr:hypothetical protein [Planctomycetota bacterium]
MIPGSELVLIPRESANDDHALLVAWAKQEGQRVVAGEKLCDLEFSKS